MAACARRGAAANGERALGRGELRGQLDGCELLSAIRSVRETTDA